jgi:adenine nucleotide transporter 17
MVSNYIVSQDKLTGRKLSYIEAFSEIYDKSGLKAFYNGYLFSLFLVLNPTINMQVFEHLKILLPRIMPKNMALFLSGALSKLAATLATYPMQTLKTVMQAGVKGRGALQEFTFLLKEFGPFGLFKGLSAKVAHSVLNSALMLFLTEKINAAVIRAVIRS